MHCGAPITCGRHAGKTIELARCTRSDVVVVVVVVVGKPCRIMAVVSAEGPIYHTPWVKGLANFNVAQADLRGCLRKIPPLPFSAKGSRVKLQNCL